MRKKPCLGGKKRYRRNESDQNEEYKREMSFSNRRKGERKGNFRIIQEIEKKRKIWGPVRTS